VRIFGGEAYERARAVKAANSLRNVDDQAVVGQRGELAADAGARRARRSA
jgi:hypothetical protein